jgi:hypothetical protein
MDLTYCSESQQQLEKGKRYVGSTPYHFYKVFRTNNDLEGTHKRWTRRSKGRVGYYPILLLVADEAAKIPKSFTLQCHGKLKREQKRSTILNQKFLFDLWDRYLRRKWRRLNLSTNGVDLLNFDLPRLAVDYENDHFSDQL